MSSEYHKPTGKSGASFLREVRRQREQKERNEKDNSFWLSVGTMGTVGWSVSAPTVKRGRKIALFVRLRGCPPYPAVVCPVEFFRPARRKKIINVSSMQFLFIFYL